MKIIKKIMTTSAMLVAVSMSAYADNHNEFYSGVGLAKTTMNYSEDSVNADYDTVNLKLLAGMKITDNFSAEVQFANFKNNSVFNQGGVNLDMKGKSFGIAGVYYLDARPPVKPFMKLGVHKWDLDIPINILGVNATASDDGTDLFGGIGVDFEEFGMITRVEYETYEFGGDVSENMNSFSISVIFNF